MPDDASGGPSRHRRVGAEFIRGRPIRGPAFLAPAAPSCRLFSRPHDGAAGLLRARHRFRPGDVLRIIVRQPRVPRCRLAWTGAREVISVIAVSSASAGGEMLQGRAEHDDQRRKEVCAARRRRVGAIC